MCEYCEENKDGFVKPIPKRNIGYNAYVWKYSIDPPHLVVTGKNHGKGIFRINYCPMCGKKLRGE